MHIACPKCNLELRCKKNSVGVEVMTDFGSYQYFHADLWACPNCGLEVIAGFGSKPIVEHYQKPKYEQLLAVERQTTSVFQVWANENEKRSYALGEKEKAVNLCFWQNFYWMMAAHMYMFAAW